MRSDQRGHEWIRRQGNSWLLRTRHPIGKHRNNGEQMPEGEGIRAHVDTHRTTSNWIQRAPPNQSQRGDLKLAANCSTSMKRTKWQRKETNTAKKAFNGSMESSCANYRCWSRIGHKLLHTRWEMYSNRQNTNGQTFNISWKSENKFSDGLTPVTFWLEHATVNREMVPDIHLP